MWKLFLSIFLMFATVTARADHSVVVYNVDTNTVVREQNAWSIRPIASITKLMTAIVALEHYSLDQRINVKGRQTVTAGTLLTSLLVRSDNQAAETLARNYPGGRSAFIAAMNDRAVKYNLHNTRFIDPSGLGVFNVSNAAEVAALVYFASEYEFVRTVSAQPEIYTVTKTKYGYKERPVYNHTSKDLLVEFDNILLSKTGYTSRAGRCITMMIETNNQRQIIVILGEPTKQKRDNLARQLIAQNSL